jgi:TatD DNase family protein
MQLIDTHCHLDFPDFDADRDKVIERAKESGIEFIINVGSSLAASRKALVLSKQYNNVFATVGIHPHEADKVKEEDFFAIEQLAKEDKVKAIGEVGLDYFRNLSSKSNQREVFRRFILLSKKNNLPLVIHCRESQDDVLSILSEEKLKTKVLMHCFSGDALFLKRCLDLGFFISFTCNVTYKKAFNLKEVLKKTALNRLMLETDAPFLAPEGLRGKRNEPMHLKLLALEVARIKGVDLEEIARMTTNNAKDFFRLA